MPLSPIPSAASLADSPVRTEAELLVRVRALVQRAFRRQLWFLFFDARGSQSPVPAPMDLPPRPEAFGALALGELLDGLAEAVGAARVAVVYERPGLAPLLGADRAWVEQLADARARTSRWPWPLVFVHSRGARLVADEECIITSDLTAS